MMNRIYLKKFLIKVVILILIFLFLLLSLFSLEKRIINQNNYKLIASFASSLKEKYPLITETEIIDIINSKASNNSLFLKYGITEKDFLTKEHKNTYYAFLIVDSIVFLSLMGLLIYLFFRYEQRKTRELKKIITYLNAINRQDYSLELDSYTEDELSILKNEIYKTTVLLKESALNSKNDKISLKKSLEDISHQLKTPLTSMNIMLDNLIEEEKNKKKKEFLHDIKREVNNLNFLVQNLLKLAKFDANTIHLKKEKIELDKLIKDVKMNVAFLSDLKNIKINIEGTKKAIFEGDYHWEKEALTNILKNCLEYSLENGEVKIILEDNKVYTMIEFINSGPTIAKKDLPHIFERFYQGQNASAESVGIGLALAKMIINKDKGTIEVTSHKGLTKFCIKYFHI